LTKLSAGTEAPDFTLPAHTGHDVTLSDYRGKQNVLLAFHPASFTGG
jgi:peroxiredoxin